MHFLTAERWTLQAVDFESVLYISAFILGIALGETLGGVMVARDDITLTLGAGVGLVLIAQFEIPIQACAVAQGRSSGRVRNLVGEPINTLLAQHKPLAELDGELRFGSMP